MKYFTLKEFDCPTELGSGSKMDKEFLELLDISRGIAGIPFTITSGYRTKQHNKDIGGVDSSSHLKGLAADLSVTDSRKRSIVLNALISAGFNRIGLAKTFIHVDLSKEKSQNVIWMY